MKRGFAAALCMLVGCSGESTAPTDPIAEARADIYERINELRATEAKAPYTVWTAGEACASAQAESDAIANDGHASFGQCGESGQNECIGYAALSQLATTCLQAMWDEGPGDFANHGHYLNLSSTSYTKVAVGIHVTASNAVWAVMNFAP